MATPLQRGRGVGGGNKTPCSGRHTAVHRTPQSALTPNDDAAERASVRRQRRSEALRKSLSDAFAAGDQGQQQGGAASKPTLSAEALSAMFEQCIKLAAENKITDKNVWQLDLIQHLPSIVRSGHAVSSSAGFNFQKMSGGLDAGVTIYSKRVDHTYKEAFQSLQGIGSANKDGDDNDDDAVDQGCEDDGDEDVEDAAAAAAKQQKADAASSKRSKQGAAKEEATLATAEQLKQKKVDNTFAVDPLFHKMSALFDEGGAKGLLLLNRSVYKGASILTDPHEVPEQQFPLRPAAEPDMLLNLKPLRQHLAACQATSSSDNSALLTPDLHQLYSLLEQAVQRNKPRQQQQQHYAVDVAAVMAAATRGLPATPMPANRFNTGAAAAATSNAPAADGDDMQCDDPDVAAADGLDSNSAAADAAAGAAGSSSVVAAFLAESVDDAAVAAAAAGSSGAGWGDGAGMYDDDGMMQGDEDGGHAGYEDDGDDGAAAGGGNWMEQSRRQSGGHGLLGLGGSGAAVDDEQEVLDAEALQQLLGGAAGSSTNSNKACTTQGSGWAGSSFWKYRSAAAAIARLGGSSGGGAVAKKQAAAGSKSRAGQLRIDFTNLPGLPAGALAQGTRKQTCLVTASTAQTLLPQDLHYQASSLGQLFLKPAPVSYIRQPISNNRSAAGADGSSTATWGDEDDGADDSWGGGDGYGDDGSDFGGYSSAAAGAEGYNAGDLSVGDPGYNESGFGGAEDDAAADGDWWSEEHELLSAPKRSTGLGVNYHRSAKQVDVRALKDLLWDSLVTVNHQAAANPDSSSSMDTDTAARAKQDAAPTIPFQDVIVSVPEQSAAGSLEDVSVHMCFICLLHLANEKGLEIRAKEDLKTLMISNVNA